MKQKPTDDLVADVLAMGMEIRQPLEDKRRRLTPLQMEGLSNAVTAIHNYLFSWKAHDLARRDTTVFPSNAKSANAHTPVTRQRVTPPENAKVAPGRVCRSMLLKTICIGGEDHSIYLKIRQSMSEVTLAHRQLVDRTSSGTAVACFTIAKMASTSFS